MPNSSGKNSTNRQNAALSGCIGGTNLLLSQIFTQKKGRLLRDGLFNKKNVSLLVVFDRQSVDHQTKTDFVNGVGKVVEQVQ